MVGARIGGKHATQGLVALVDDAIDLAHDRLVQVGQVLCIDQCIPACLAGRKAPPPNDIAPDRCKFRQILIVSLYSFGKACQFADRRDDFGLLQSQVIGRRPLRFKCCW